MKDLIAEISELKQKLSKVWTLVEIDKKKQEIIRLHHKMSEPGFWDNQEKAKKISQKANDLEEEVEKWENFKKDLQALGEIVDLGQGKKDKTLAKEADEQIGELQKSYKQLEFDLLFNGKYDRHDAVVTINAGAGGTDAQDWAEMLLRMYLRFCENQDWSVDIISISSGGEAGLKSVMFEVSGAKAYGYLKAENGVHRLVRISPFDAEKMRHTSFAMVEVLPFLDEETEVEIKSDDLRIDTFKAGGHGGQGVNTTDSAVRITHLPTGVVAACQNERSQAQNKQKALQILKSKLQQYFETEKQEEKEKLRGQYTEAAWGNQIRSYVLHPYKMVKDHRCDYQSTEVEKVLDGDLMSFIKAYLRHEAGEKV
ncbi:MAG TPA: peptide chain release factor 2 [Patescibacteria group bacterium]|nr:peptide chain release factor 2 [Patescibacteria group bacterium]